MGAGGIGAFAQGFTNSFQSSLQQRRLREQMDLENSMKIEREKRLNEQFEQQQSLRERQFEALEEWRTGQREVQQKQLEIQQKNGDLQVMGAWEKVLDPTKPKALRRFMFKQLSSSLGIDSKSSQYKDFETMLQGMDDEALADIRTGLFALLPDATPGQVTDLSRAIISGQMQMKDVVAQFSEQATQRRVRDKLSLTGPSGPQASTKEQPSGEDGTQVEPTTEEFAHTFTAEQLRAKAVELAQDPEMDTDQVRLFRDLARDIEQSNQEKLELKQVVTTDAEGNRVEKWVREEEALGMEAPSGRPVPTADEAKAKAEAEALADQDVKRLEPVHERAETARQMLPQVETYRQLLKTGRFQTGSFAGLRESIGQIGRLVGIDQNTLDALAGLKVGDPAISESMDAISKQMALTFASDVSRLTNMSLELISGAVPSLLKTPEGNEIILEVYETKGQQAIEIQDLAENYISQYGTLRPKGKPSFFEEQNKILRRGLLKPDFEERFLKAKKAGEGVDLTKIINASKSEAITLKDEDGSDVTFEIVGKTDKGVPTVRLRDGKEYPYASTPEEAKKLPPGTLFLRQDPLKGPVLWEAK